MLRDIKYRTYQILQIFNAVFSHVPVGVFQPLHAPRSACVPVIALFRLISERLIAYTRRLIICVIAHLTVCALIQIIITLITPFVLIPITSKPCLLLKATIKIIDTAMQFCWIYTSSDTSHPAIVFHANTVLLRLLDATYYRSFVYRSIATLFFRMCSYTRLIPSLYLRTNGLYNSTPTLYPRNTAYTESRQL